MTASRPPRVTGSGGLASAYEDLRAEMQEGEAPRWPRGLGILLGRGMAAWAKAAVEHAPEGTRRPSPEATRRGMPIPATVSQELVQVLAAMTWAAASQEEEVTA